MDHDSFLDDLREQDAESRFATFVKFDIVDSTRTWRKLSRPDGLALLRAFRGAVAQVLQPHEVKIEWEGDGALVSFGYPEVRVDAAEAAVRSSLELIDAVRSVNAIPGVQLELRIGISSGLVTIDLPSGAFESLSIVLAERLKQQAKPGEVLIAEDTRRLVKHFFEYSEARAERLKGFDQPTRFWRVLGASATVSRFAAQRFEPSQPDIVGREQALAQLRTAWGNALQGRGSAVCLVGDAGVGKSRLARVLVERAEREDAVVLEIHCTPSTRNSPLLPVGVLLRRLAGIQTGSSAADKTAAASGLLERLLGESEARAALPYLAPLFGLESAPLPLDKTREEVRANTIGALVELVRVLATQRPLVWLCEDLHWADDSTIHLTQIVARMIGEFRAVMILTRWPPPVAAPFEFEPGTSASTIAVEPLTLASAADLVRAIAGQALTPEHVDDIVNRCGGVPLLLEEVTRRAVEESCAGDDVPMSPHASTSVPPELQLVVGSRLSRWPNLKSIIEAASVLGCEFPICLLQQVIPNRAQEVCAALTLFADHGLLAPGAPNACRASFRHRLIRDAVYETLVSKEYLQRLHSRAADRLMEEHGGTPDASADVLAQHLRVAERVEEAIRVRLTAAEDTFNRGAYVEANGHCEAARELLGTMADTTHLKSDVFRASVLRGMIGTGLHGYSSDIVTTAYLEAQQMFDASTAVPLRYPVMRGLATSYLVRGELAMAYRYSLDAFELAGVSGRADHRIDAMSVLAYTSLYFRRLEECRTWIQQCLALYDTEGGERFQYPVPQNAKSAALALLPTAAWLLGDSEGTEQAIERGLQHVAHIARDFDTALMHAWVAGTRYTQRRYEDALRHAGIAYELGKQHRFQEWEGIGAMVSLLSRAALQPAPELVAQAIALGGEFKAKGIGLNASYYLCGIARGLIVAGNPEDASLMLSVAEQAAEHSQETRMNPEIWMLQAELQADDAQAVPLLMQAYSLADTQGAITNALRAAIAILLRIGNDRAVVDRARRSLDLLDGRTRPSSGSAQWLHEEWAHVRELLLALEPLSKEATTTAALSTELTGC